MKRTGKKLSLSRSTLRTISDGLSLVGGGLETDYVNCSLSCGYWDSDVVKTREGGGGKEGK